MATAIILCLTFNREIVQWSLRVLPEKVLFVKFQQCVICLRKSSIYLPGARSHPETELLIVNRIHSASSAIWMNQDYIYDRKVNIKELMFCSMFFHG